MFSVQCSLSINGARKKMAERSRTWVSIGYPDTTEEEGSLKQTWLTDLAGLGIQCFVSPLHDSDKYEKDVLEGSQIKHKKGDLKKPHFHFIWVFDSVKSQPQVQSIFNSLHKEGSSAPLVLQCLSLRGAVRYLCHKDNKEKFQYSEDDVLCFGGLDKTKYLVNDSEKEEDLNGKITQIFNLVAEHELSRFCDVAEFLISNHIDLFTVFRKNSFFFSQVLRDKSFKNVELSKKQIY